MSRITRRAGLYGLVVSLGLLPALGATARERRVNVTGAGGRTVQRHVATSRDPATQSATRLAETTGPRGQTVTRQGSASVSDGTLSGSSTVTGPAGRSRTTSYTATRTP